MTGKRGVFLPCRPNNLHIFALRLASIPAIYDLSDSQLFLFLIFFILIAVYLFFFLNFFVFIPVTWSVVTGVHGAYSTVHALRPAPIDYGIAKNTLAHLQRLSSRL